MPSESLNINDLPVWVVCAKFPQSGLRNGCLVVGTQDEREGLLRAGRIFLTNWARDKHLDQTDVEFHVHLQSEREQCRICVPNGEENHAEESRS